MFIPGEVLLRELASELAGVWFVIPDNQSQPVIINKLSTPVIKLVYRFVDTFLLISKVRVENEFVRIVGLRIHDDSNYPQFTSYPIVNDSDHIDTLPALIKFLNLRNAQIHFFDERNRPVMSGFCTIDEREKITKAIELLSPSDQNVTKLDQIANLAHDKFQRDIELAFMGGEPIDSEIIALKLIIRDLNVFNIIELNDSQYTGNYRLDDIDEGNSLEKLANASLATIFGKNTYLSPTVKTGKYKRELTDILSFGQDQICLLECKALSVLQSAIDRSRDRRVKLIEKDIKKGLSQLKGAIRNLLSGVEIASSQNNPIFIPNIKVSYIHGIVLLSEMYPFVNWAEVAKGIKNYSNPDKNYILHVIDLAQFQRICSVAKSPVLFSNHLLDRFLLTLADENAFIRTVTSPYE
jgi:hypothetical protein